MASVDNELEELRRRAYGRQGDIHLDARALERLRELEGEKAAQSAGEATEPTEQFEPAGREPPPVPSESPLPQDEPEERDLRSTLGRWFEWLRTLRRSTIVMALSVLAVVIAVVVTLTLVQRVQTDPLQTGATQIARLEPDPGYVVPNIFGGPGGAGEKARAYQEIHGLRVVVTALPTDTGTTATSDCVSIYLEASITDPTSTSFTGPFFGGCAVGRFPAMTQFGVRSQDLPAEVRKGFAPWTALQFVYDKRDHEVVVFGSK